MVNLLFFAGPKKIYRGSAEKADFFCDLITRSKIDNIPTPNSLSNTKKFIDSFNRALNQISSVGKQIKFSKSIIADAVDIPTPKPLSNDKKFVDSFNRALNQISSVGKQIKFSKSIIADAVDIPTPKPLSNAKKFIGSLTAL